MRRLLGTALAALVALGAAALGAPASAAPVPFVAVDCGQSVHAFRGQPVHLSRIAVSRFVADAVRADLGGLRAATVGLVFPLGPAIPVGTVPDGTGEISGESIADAVAGAVAPMGEIAPAAESVTASVRELVADACGMRVRALNPTERGDTERPAPTEPGVGPGAPNPGGSDPSTTPNTQPVGGADPAPDEIELYDPDRFARAAPRDYGGVPVAEAGRFVPSPESRYGVPGYSPRFGLLGQDSAIDPLVHAAGEARALPVGAGRVALPVLLAVLALSLVTGALVRTWVLRRA